jgi:hypothetical protein
MLAVVFPAIQGVPGGLVISWQGREVRPFHTMFQMEDAKALVMSWHEKGHGSLTIWQIQSASFDRKCPAHSTVIDWIRKLKRGEDIIQRASSSGRLPECPRAITLSFRVFTLLGHQIYRHKRMEAPARNLHLVPRTLSPAPKAERVTAAIESQQCWHW